MTGSNDINALKQHFHFHLFVCCDDWETKNSASLFSEGSVTP